MAKVTLEFRRADETVIEKKDILTTGDPAYLFDDISEHLHEDIADDFAKVPRGTKQIVLFIDCDM